jgi:hypothetical protein
MSTNPLYSALAVGAALSLGCAERPSPVAPALALQTVSPASAPASFVTSVLNPCNSEFVDIEGWIQFRYETRTNPLGGTTTVGRILEHGDGTGEITGVRYEFSADTILTATSGAVQFGATQDVVVRLLAQGRAPNFLGLEVLHFTVNPNGDLVGVVEDFRSECR